VQTSLQQMPLEHEPDAHSPPDPQAFPRVFLQSGSVPAEHPAGHTPSAMPQAEAHENALPLFAQIEVVPVHFVEQLPHASEVTRAVSHPSSGFELLQLP
jgi:hypothetical protein